MVYAISALYSVHKILSIYDVCIRYVIKDNHNFVCKKCQLNAVARAKLFLIFLGISV